MPFRSDQKNLDPLPESTSDFWKEAEVHTGLVPHDILAGHGHYFKRISGHQAYCEGCNWGFQLDFGDKIKEGHLYDKDDKFVI